MNTFAALVAVALASQESNTCILGTQTGCSTDIALGLTKQIAAKMN